MPINFLKKFRNLNVNTDMMIKNANFKNNLIEYKCLCCKKNHHQKFDEKLKKQFFNRYKSSDNDNNKFILL